MKKEFKATIQYVFRVNFNDTYFLENYKFVFNSEKLEWFDPFKGRNKNSNILIAIKSYSNNEFVVLENRLDKIKEVKVEKCMEYILCEDYDESMMLAIHISEVI